MTTAFESRSGTAPFGCRDIRAYEQAGDISVVRTVGGDRLREAETPLTLQWLCVGKTHDLDAAICALHPATGETQ